MVEVRIATGSDAQEILNIYSPYILTKTTTFETEVPTVEAFATRMEQYLQKYPWLVCSIDNKISGYAYASIFKEREAYQWSCECSVYIKEQYKGLGIGKELYAVLLPILKMQGIRNVFAGITLPNEASIKLHERNGFKIVAVYENVGYKLNGWKSVGWWRLQLNEYNKNPAPPIQFSQMNHQQFSESFRKAAYKIQSRCY